MSRASNPRRPTGVTEAELSAKSARPIGPSPVVTGYVEKMMRVSRPQDDNLGASGVRRGLMETGHWVLDLDGLPTGASAAVIMDNALSSSIRNEVDGIHWMVTTELHLDFMRRLPSDGTVLEAWTRTLVGSEVGGMASGTLRGPDGTGYVHATGWFHRVEGNSAGGLERYAKTARQPLGTDSSASLGALLAAGPATPAIPGSRPALTEHFVQGLEFARKDTLGNSHGAVHGGVLMMMASLAAQQAMSDRAAFDLQSVRVAYLRPASGAISSRTRVRHVGSSLRVVEVELFSGAADGSGKPFLQATAIFHASR